MKHPIPDTALDDRLFFAGTAGSGKTYNAMGRVERLLAHKARVVIPDPLGVWWGLRLDSDGKGQSPYDVVIFGGPHGDLPLTEHAGALIGETVAGMKESCILDLSQLGTKASERRFMLSFLTALHKHATKEPLHVVFDEADMWSPQRLLDKEGDAAKLLGMMETIVRRGRVRGFIPWLISQRPAVISKDVLSQVDGLIAFKLTSSQDRDAIGDWVEGQADKQQWRDIWASLPTMERGQGVVWIPGRGILNTVQFPQKETFDSSRTPKRGERLKRAAELKPLDLGKLKERLAKVEAETKASDPKALRAQIAEKDRALATLQRQTTEAVKGKSVADPDAIAKAEERGFERAKKQIGVAAEREAQAKVLVALEGIRAVMAPIGAAIDDAIRDARKTRPAVTADVQYVPSSRPPAIPVTGHTAPRLAPNTVASDGATYTRPQMRVLQSLAMWRSLGHESPSREMVAAVAGYSPSSGGFNNLLGTLNVGSESPTAGAICYPSSGLVSLLADGVGVPSEADGRDKLLSTLSNPQRKIIGALVDRGTQAREDIGAITGYSSSSGGFNNLLGKLRTLGLIDYPAPGFVMMTEWAQDLLTGHASRIAA